MRTIKLALSVIGVCALLGASTSAHARFGASSRPGVSPSSKSSAATRIERPMRANPTSIKAKLGAAVTQAKSKLGPTAKLGGVSNGLPSPTRALAKVAVGLGAIAGSAYLIGSNPAVAAQVIGGAGVLLGALLAHSGWREGSLYGRLANSP